MKDITWNTREKGIARQAFQKAYEREGTKLINRVKEIASASKHPKTYGSFTIFLLKREMRSTKNTTSDTLF